MALLTALQRGARVYDLSVPMHNGMPSSPASIPYSMAISRRHGDLQRAETRGTGSNAVIITGDHVGTHVDALCHVARDGVLRGGIAVQDACVGGTYKQLGVETIRPMFCRGVFLDIPGLKGKQRLDPGEGITETDLKEALGDTALNEGDVVLIRTGWTQLYADPVAYKGHSTGTPGVNAEAGRWLASRKIRAAGADTISFEQVALGPDLYKRPVHGVLLWENGIHIIEVMDLEELAKDKVKEFLFILSPLKLVGATASPVRPLAIVDA